MNYPAASYGVSVIPDRLKLSENVWNKKNGISSAGRTGETKETVQQALLSPTLCIWTC
jgi:hypothetical protein